MKIKYIHSSAPELESTHDTVKSFKNSSGFVRSMGVDITQKDWDKMELEHFEKDFQKGTILKYSVVEEV